MSRQLLPVSALLILCSLPLPSRAVSAQMLPSEPADGWNDPEALELVSRARQARETLAASADLQTYQARTEGHVYFFIDPEEGERYLIRIDQIATEISWMAPNILRQRVVGERSETRLPVRDFDYYLDRLTLVPHGFDDEIRIGSGLDVRGVYHPLARPGRRALEEEVYDFRMGESLALTVAGRSEPVRIQEVIVRPRDPDRPGILGTIHLDLASGSIVRMAFSFTPASYVDPRNDRISVELDYGLWEGRYWLPNVQRIEVRREIPALDLGIGTVIRAVLQVRDYNLDAPLAGRILELPPVMFAPVEERRAYAFSDGLYESMQEDGLEELIVDADLGELRARALELLSTVPPSGLAPVRFHYPGVSSAFRYDRFEGVRVGLGGSMQPKPGLRIRGSAGYSLVDARPQATVTLEELLTAELSLRARVQVRGLDDLGLSRGSAPLVSSIGALFRGEDYLDPYWVSGGSIRLEYRTDLSQSISFEMGIERHSSASLELDMAPLNGSRDFRPVRQVAEAEFFRFDVRTRRSVSFAGGEQGRGDLGATLLHGQAGSGLGISAEVDERWRAGSPAREVRLLTTAWTWLGDSIAQGHRLLGGRGTVPGFPYRQWVGRHSATTSLTWSGDLFGPLLRVRSGVHAGWADGGDPQLARDWGATSTHGVRTAISIGLGLGWDILHLDLARGFDGGEWQLLLSLDRRWWDRL